MEALEPGRPEVLVIFQGSSEVSDAALPSTAETRKPLGDSGGICFPFRAEFGGEDCFLSGCSNDEADHGDGEE